jgi:indoleacetamide hydrolase
VAVGEDTLGSIRVPASCCGVFGFRSTFGRYSSDGVMPMTRNKFNQVDSLTRSVADLLLFDTALAAETAPVAPPALKDTRIGILPRYFEETLDHKIEFAFRRALAKLREAGASIVEVDASAELDDASAIAVTIKSYDMVASISRFLGECNSNVTFDQLLSVAGQGTQRVVMAFGAAAESTVGGRLRSDARKARKAQAGDVRLYSDHALSALAFPTIGCVWLVLPVGLTNAGLPIGVEFDAPHGADRDLLGLGPALENSLERIKSPAI